MALVAVATLTPAAASAAESAPPGICSTAMVPTGAYQIAGTLCVPTSSTPDTVVVLVPGATYSQVYWDVAIDPETYNTRAALNRGGYATFVVDRLGSGASSKPPSVTVTEARQVEAVHAVVDAVRNGRAGLPAFPSVVLGGHSLGSTIVILEASRYRGVDAVVLTGFSHAPNAVGFAALVSTLVPARPDVGYLTTRPGTRSAFYGDGDVAPDIAAYDEATKDVISIAEIPEAATTLLPVPAGIRPSAIPWIPQTSGITAPVLLVNGTDDRQFCGPPLGSCTTDSTLHAAEEPFFASAATFTARVIPGAGHDLALSRTAPAFHRALLEWLQATAPPGG